MPATAVPRMIVAPSGPPRRPTAAEPTLPTFVAAVASPFPSVPVARPAAPATLSMAPCIRPPRIAMTEPVRSAAVPIPTMADVAPTAADWTLRTPATEAPPPMPANIAPNRVPPSCVPAVLIARKEAAAIVARAVTPVRAVASPARATVIVPTVSPSGVREKSIAQSRRSPAVSSTSARNGPIATIDSKPAV